MMLVYGDDAQQAHLEMFLVDLRYTRLDFAPVLWQRLFFPYLRQIMIWYLEQRRCILSDGQGSSFQPSYESQDVIRSCRQRPLSSMNSEQSIQMAKLENIYEVAMDENLRQYVLYYRALMKHDSAQTEERHPNSNCRAAHGCKQTCGAVGLYFVWI
jgi:hypothetical protein